MFSFLKFCRRLHLEAQDRGEQIKKDRRKKTNNKYEDIAMVRIYKFFEKIAYRVIFVFLLQYCILKF